MTGIDTFFQIVNLGILIGIAYSLRRIFLLERRIKAIDTNLLKIVKRKK